MRPFAVSVLSVAVLAVAALADTKFALNGDNTKITFVGTKPGGKHDGGFKALTGTATVGADPATLKVEVEIDVNSLYSDTPKLTAHLKSPDFFSVKKYPRAKFVSTKVQKASADYIITGDFTMLGKTKSITFPATLTATGETLKLNARFRINRSEWGMSYGKGKVDEPVSLTVALNAKK